MYFRAGFGKITVSKRGGRNDETEIMLSSQAPRDDETIKKALYESIAINPMLASLQDDARYKSLLVNLQHHLRLQEGN